MSKKITIAEIAKKFGLNEEEIEIVSKKTIELSKVKRGETVLIGNEEYIVFNHLENGTTQLVSKNFVFKNIKFDEDSNNYSTSSIRKKLNTEYLTHIGKFIGTENIVPHKVELTTIDGRKDFGKCEDYISLPTFNFVRENIDVFDMYKDCIDDWQFLATAWSTESTENKYGVCCLLPGGDIDFDNCGRNYGVRAFGTFKSNIFVSY